MKAVGIGPGRQLGDEVDFAEELTHHLGRVVALTQLLDLSKEPDERLLDLTDSSLGIVLALTLEALMMLDEFLAEELGKTSTAGATEGPGKTFGDGARLTLRGHFSWADPV
jgi:hypothetical protein